MASSTTRAGNRRAAKKTVSNKGGGLFLIGAYKLLECAALIAAGIGAIRLMHRDVQEVAMHWVHVLRVDPDNHYIHAILGKVFAVSPKQLRELSIGTFVYAVLRFFEGLGLVLRKKWGEYLTIFATGLFIPLEIWEIFHRVTPVKLIVFALNAATLWYLIWALNRDRGRAKA